MGIVEGYIHFHKTGRQRCTICGKCIPSDIPRISMGYSSGYGHSSHRVCGLCLIKLAKHINENHAEPINKWRKKLLIDEL